METSESVSESPVEPEKVDGRKNNKGRMENLVPGWKKPKEGNARTASPLLRDMRRVYQNPQATNLTPGQRVCKELLEENPKEFISRLSSLEQAHQATVVRAAASGVESALEEKSDEGTERCEELIGRMLGEAGQESGRGDAVT